MSEEKNKRSGIVSIVGRPNVGKSTLINNILGTKISIVSKVPQTTRFQIRGIHNDDRGQIVFIDTPGMHLGTDKLDKLMNQSSSGSIDAVDCVIYLADVSRKIGREEENVVQKIAALKCPVVLGLNKVDIKNNLIPEYIAHWERAKGCPVQEMKDFQMVALSGEKEVNVDKLLDVVFDFLPEGPQLYPDDVLSDLPKRLAIADIIREKLFKTMKEEVPHSVGVFIEDMKPIKGKTMSIKTLIYVERDTQKGIVIGKNGETLKKIGTLAREDLENLLECKVYLDIHVKVKANWRDNHLLLQELGYDLNAPD